MAAERQIGAWNNVGFLRQGSLINRSFRADIDMSWSSVVIERRGADDVSIMFVRDDILCVYSRSINGPALICFLGGKVYGASHG